MPKRKKKQSLAWRATKAVAKGVGKGSWWALKTTAKGVAKGSSLAAGKIKEKNKERALKKQPSYNASAKFSKLEAVSGEGFESFTDRLRSESLILLVFGKRGSGKSALGFRLLENIHSKTKRSCYVLGVKQEVLPKWISTVESVDDVADGGVIVVDEGALAFSSRDSMSSVNKALGKLMAIARHKDLTLIFITQNTGMIDRTVLSLTDTLVIKQGSLLQQKMERPEIKQFYEKAQKAFSKLEGDRKQYAYVVDSDFEGVVKISLPSFWSTKISKSRA